MSKLPTDNSGKPIPALRLKDDGAHSITSSGTSARNSTAFTAKTKVVSVFATEDVYLKFGDSSLTATTSDHFFPAGVYYDMALGEVDGTKDTHLAVLQVSTGGTVYVSEKV